MSSAPHSGTSQKGDMTFWEHINALRGVLIKSLLSVGILWLVFLSVMPRIFDSIILAPCRADFPTYRLLESLSRYFSIPGIDASEGFNVNLINIQLASQFFIHISSAFWLALTVATPVILFHIWQFVAPALYDHERRAASRAFISGTLLFFIGAATGYYIVFPLTLRFLAGYQMSPLIPNQISLDSYMDNFTMLILMMGLVFELPIVAWMLGRLGILSRSLFIRYRRHAIVAMLIVAAIITPTGDPFTLMVVFIPVYLLWEAGALLVPREANEVQSAQSQQS